MNITYERISWGWIAYCIIDGHLRKGRGCTKQEAKQALLSL